MSAWLPEAVAHTGCARPGAGFVFNMPRLIAWVGPADRRQPDRQFSAGFGRAAMAISLIYNPQPGMRAVSAGDEGQSRCRREAGQDVSNQDGRINKARRRIERRALSDGRPLSRSGAGRAS